MLKNYLKIAFRNIIRYKVFSVINILGLALGLTCFIVALLWDSYHIRFDRQNVNYNQIYRVNRLFFDPNGSVNLYLNQNAPQVGPLLKNDFPDIISSTRIKYQQQLMSVGDNHFTENRFVYADNAISNIFTFDWLEGNAKTALLNPNSLVITEDVAKKYFNKNNVLGETINCETNSVKYSYKITGVIKNFPATSTLQFDFIGSMSTWENLVGSKKMQDWSNNDYITFILLPQGYDSNRLKSRLDWCINKNIGPGSDKWTKLELEKFSDIHMSNFREPMFYMTLVAFLILLVACFNFINLFTARSATRAKEIGIRKVVGALKTQIVKQLLFESVLTTLISYIAALFLVVLIIPGFNKLFSADIAMNQLADFKLISILTMIVVLIGIFAGILPSFFFASFKPYNILKGALVRVGRKASFRKTLVVAQFAISSIFIVCVSIISSQLDFMQNKKLGFNKDDILILPSSNFIQNNFEAVKQQLLQNPNIISVTGASRVPPDQLNDAGRASVFINNEFKNIEFRLPYIEVDLDYIPTFEIKIIAGRNFSQQFQTDLSESFILNETAVKKMGFKSAYEAINTPLRYNNRNGKIIGVVKDFHFEAVNRKISPIIMLQSPSYNIIAARISGKNIQSTLAFLQTKWAEFNPNYSFHCSSVDNMFERQYSSEMKIRELFAYSSLLAILIACLGLFGLAAHLIQQRTKEIGIRKVLGASVPTILYMLSKDFAKWVILSNIIAWPIAWYIINIWLQNYAYRIDISWWVFVLSGVIALIIALLTVSFQAIKAAIANPVKTLRYE